MTTVAIRALRLIDPRPQVLPPGWDREIPAHFLIFNAHRPLFGARRGEGSWGHGRHYAAVDPASPDANWQVQANVRLDARLIEFVPDAELAAFAEVVAAEYQVPLAELDEGATRVNFLTEHGQAVRMWDGTRLVTEAPYAAG